MGIDIYIGRATIPGSSPPEMPIISRSAATSASSGTGSNAVDGAYDTMWTPTGSSGTLAIDLRSRSSAEKSSVMAAVFNGTRPTIDPPVSYGIPSAFTLEKNTSSSATAPTTGWTTVATVSGNAVGSGCRSQWIFPGLNLSDAGWFRVNVTASAGNGISLAVDLHDAQNGTSDSISFYGDSNTEQCFNGGALAGGALTGGSLETLLETATGRAAPAIVNLGLGGWTADGAYADRAKVSAYGCKYVPISFGTNDANNVGSTFTSGSAQATSYKNYVQQMITYFEGLGCVVILPTILWGNANSWTANNIQSLNVKIAELLVENPNVIPGPDLYTFSSTNQNLIIDGLHLSYETPTLSGLTGYEWMLRLWRDVLVSKVYGS